MLQVILDAGGLPPALLSESLAAAKKDGKTEIAAALEKAGAVMPVVATLTPAQLARYPGTYNDGRQEAVLRAQGRGVDRHRRRQPDVDPLAAQRDQLCRRIGFPGSTVTFAIEGEQATSLTVVNQTGVPAVYKRVSK